MKVYQSSDGVIFDSEEAVEEYEKLKADSMFVIVDDDPTVLKIISVVLDQSRIGYKIFQDPLDAMNFISKNQVNHVFTDFHMKGYGMSGKWIKEICNQKNTPCSIVSGDSAIADILKTDFMENCLAYMKI